MSSKLKFKRILLKLSGEVLEGDKDFAIDFDYLKKLSFEIAELKKLGVQIALVIGGGNFWRYRDFSHSGLDRVRLDKMGMMATIMNGSAMKGMFEKIGVKSHVMSALHLPQVAEDYIAETAREYLENGDIVICSGGTGNPFFTTDSAAALRALELNCDALFKATKVDGVYSADPEKDKKAKFFKNIKYKEVLEKNLKVMDLTAVSLAKDSRLPIVVFNLSKKGNIKKAVLGEKVGTLVS